MQSAQAVLTQPVGAQTGEGDGTCNFKRDLDPGAHGNALYVNRAEISMKFDRRCNSVID